MTLIIDRVATPDRKLSHEITELVRQTKPELLSPERPSSRSNRWFALAVAAALGAATMALLAFTHTSAHAADVSSRMAQEHLARAVALGPDRSEAPYRDCIKSLGQSLPNAVPVASLDAGALTMRQKAQLACADVGLQPGSIPSGGASPMSASPCRAGNRSTADRAAGAGSIVQGDENDRFDALDHSVVGS